jgi:hypothetical protein
MTNTQITALITAIQDGGANTALEVRTVLTAIKNACVLPNEVKFIKMPQGDISTYFLTTGVTAGLGIAGQLYEGWAICNGNNTTTDDSGRTSIAYGTGYTTLGARDGSKDAVIVEHNHEYASGDLRYPVMTKVPSDGTGTNVGTNTPSGFLIGQGQGPRVASAGESGTNKNMQPYVVELKIQRIA